MKIYHHRNRSSSSIFDKSKYSTNSFISSTLNSTNIFPFKLKEKLRYEGIPNNSIKRKVPKINCQFYNKYYLLNSNKNLNTSTLDSIRKNSQSRNENKPNEYSLSMSMPKSNNPLKYEEGILERIEFLQKNRMMKRHNQKLTLANTKTKGFLSIENEDFNEKNDGFDYNMIKDFNKLPIFAKNNKNKTGNGFMIPINKMNKNREGANYKNFRENIIKENEKLQNNNSYKHSLIRCNSEISFNRNVIESNNYGDNINKFGSATQYFRNEILKGEEMNWEKLTEYSKRILFTKLKIKEHQNLLDELYKFEQDLKKEYLDTKQLEDKYTFQLQLNNQNVPIDNTNNSCNSNNCNKDTIKNKDKEKEEAFKSKNDLNNENFNHILMENKQIQLKDQIKNLGINYKSLENELQNLITVNNESLEKNKKQLSGYKKICSGLIKSQSEYYLEILKNGTDTRKNGLSWAIKKLIEMNIKLEDKNFPVFLNDEHIKFLINISKYELEFSQLREVFYMLTDQELKNLKDIFNSISKNKKISYGKNSFFITKANKKLSKGELLKKKFQKFLNQINGKYFCNDEDDEVLDDNKIKEYLNHIKLRINDINKNDKFPNNLNASGIQIFKIIYENIVRNDMYNDLQSIHGRIEYLGKVIKDTTENQLNKFKEKYYFYKKKFPHMNFDEYKLIFHALFGNKFSFDCLNC